MISSTWMAPNLLCTALPSVPKAWVAKKTFPPFISIVALFSLVILWALGSLNPTTPAAMMRL